MPLSQCELTQCCWEVVWRYRVHWTLSQSSPFHSHHRWCENVVSACEETRYVNRGSFSPLWVLNDWVEWSIAKDHQCDLEFQLLQVHSSADFLLQITEVDLRLHVPREIRFLRSWNGWSFNRWWTRRTVEWILLNQWTHYYEEEGLLLWVFLAFELSSVVLLLDHAWREDMVLFVVAF